MAAGSGPLLIALLISYLPTLYGAFNRRETEVSLLAGRGGSLAWGPEILLRYQWAGLRSELGKLYQDWERLTADIAESHSSYPILVHFRSPDPRRSWITSMIAVMDAAAIELARTPERRPRLGPAGDHRRCVRAERDQPGARAAGGRGSAADRPDRGQLRRVLRRPGRAWTGSAFRARPAPRPPTGTFAAGG